MASHFNQTHQLKSEDPQFPSKWKKFKTSSNISFTANYKRNRHDFKAYIDSRMKSIHTLKKEDALYIKQLNSDVEALKKKNKESHAELIIEKAYSINKKNAIRSYDFNKKNHDIRKRKEEVLLPKISVRKMKEKLIEESERLFPEHYYDNSKMNGISSNEYQTVMSTMNTDLPQEEYTLPETPKDFHLKYLKEPYNQYTILKKVNENYRPFYDKYHVIAIKFDKHKNTINKFN